MSEAARSERDLRVTVYNEDLGLVSDRRSLALSESGDTLELTDVPARLDPTSVHLASGTEDGGVEVLEQNFQYDLADSDRIMLRYLGRVVELVTKNDEVKRGTLTSFQGGAYVLTVEDGGVNIVRQEQVVDVRLPKLPAGLRTRPTLVWRVAAADGGAVSPGPVPVPVQLSYMTAGIRWHAEYVAICDAADTSMSLSAWVSIENNAGATFPDARLQLVAGEVNRVREVLHARKAMRAAAAFESIDDAQHFEEESFFEYHLYSLGRRTTISDRETKQIALFPSAVTPVEKLYEYRGQQDAKKVSVVLEAENRAERGLGMPLPAGKVRTYKRDQREQLQFIGEDKIEHTPKNEKIRLRIGTAFDVVAERTDLAQRQVSPRVTEADVEIKLRNRKDEAIEVVVLENQWGDWRILRESQPHEKKDARTARFTVPVAPDAESVLTYTVRISH